MVNGWKVTAIISMILATIFLFLFITMSYAYILINNELVYEYEDMNEDWCEIINDYSELYNLQLDWLIYYDEEVWKDSEKAEIIDCEE